MARKTKTKAGGDSGVQAWFRALAAHSGIRWGKALGWTLAVVAVAALGAAAMHVLEQRVLFDQAAANPGRVRVTLCGKPSWMPDAVADQIAASLQAVATDYFDRDLTAKVHAAAETCPWVRNVLRVEKQRAGAAETAVIVEAEFRMPVAAIRTGLGCAYVDIEGVRLPAEQVPLWAAHEGRPGDPDDAAVRYYLRREDVPPAYRPSRVHYILIEGAGGQPPPVGGRWEGDDLAAGMRLIELIRCKPYAWQITAVDVRNYNGRLYEGEPHLRMYAQCDRSPVTDIRFGHFPRPDGDFRVSPERKISYLDQYVRDHDGRLAGINRTLDLRHDELHVSYN